MSVLDIRFERSYIYGVNNGCSSYQTIPHPLWKTRMIKTVYAAALHNTHSLLKVFADGTFVCCGENTLWIVFLNILEVVIFQKKSNSNRTINHLQIGTRWLGVGYLAELGKTWYAQILSNAFFFAFETLKNVKWFEFQICLQFCTCDHLP